ncbi:type II toxin-antitoxin system Phd/YefM family antitoxin [Prosthecobacter sp.]|uniref:type II toxin-antitoxin system Phd/YefM family antitoxin n=1 Tax=Prosthecobacter sp. TaxID=1965333 RepID=UPI00378399B1
MISLSVSEAGRHFAELLHRVQHEGEWALLTDGGMPVVRMMPANRVPKGAELALIWEGRPRLGDEEAARFESDIAEARAALPPVHVPWD